MKIRNLLPLIGIVIFIYILYKLDIKEIISTAASVNIFLLVLTLILIIPIIILQTLKWYLILKEQNINLDFSYLIKIQLVSTFYGFLTPGRVGSLIKIWYIKEKAKKSIGESTSSVVLERLLDLVIVSLFALIGALLLIKIFSNLVWQITIFVIILIILIYIFISKKRSSFIINFLHKFLIPKKYKDKALESYNHFYDTLVHPKRLILPLMVTFIIWILIYSQVYMLAVALSIKIPYLFFIFMFPIATIVSLIPITITGLGTREATLIYLFSIFNIAPEKIFTLSILFTLLYMIISLVGGVLIFKKDKIIRTI